MNKKIFNAILILISIFVICLFGCGPEVDPPTPVETPKYVVRFFVDEELIETQEVLEGADAIAPHVEKEGFEFVSWDKDFTNVKSDIDTNAIFEDIYFEVSFILDGNEIVKKNYKYGEIVDLSKVEELSNVNLPEGKVLEKWDYDNSPVKSNIVINGIVYTKTYEVKFIGLDGKVLKTEVVSHGEAATAPKDIEEEGYIFKNWDKDFTNVLSDLEVNAIYDQNSYNVSFYFGSTKLNISPRKYSPGTRVTLPTDIGIAGYSLTGWYVSDISQTKYLVIDENMTGDLVFYARCVETVKHSPLRLPETPYHFTDIKKIAHSSGNGTYVFQPVFPTGLESTSSSAYNWSTSDSTIATVSAYSSITAKSIGFCVLTATSISNPNLIVNCVIKVTADGIEYSTVEEANKIKLNKVRFLGMNNEVIDEVYVVDGSYAVCPAPLSYEGYKFVGWDKDNYNIKADTDIKAIYEEGNNPYEGKKISILGDSISTFDGLIPAGYATFYPYPTADFNDPNCCWWMQLAHRLGGSIFVNNSYSGSCVSANEERSGKNMSRIQVFNQGGQVPDVLVVYFGSNDCASKYVSVDMFKDGFEKMMNNIYQVAPNIDVVLVTLVTTKYYSDSAKDEFNQVIIDNAIKYNCKLIDINEVDISDSLLDSAHPNLAGQTKLANAIYDGLFENYFNK